MLVGSASVVLCRAGLLGKGILVALSGGIDSVALLHVVLRVQQIEGGRVEVAHVDHGLREDSETDSDFARGLAQRLGLPFHLLHLARSDFQRGFGVQAEARRLRRRFLEETLRHRTLSAVALGHHADDQVETVLFRLLRGAGPKGVSGMAEWTSPYVRPLLSVWREEIQCAAVEQGWVHREDPSNRKMQYSRNRLRHETLPMLRAVHPGADRSLQRFARLAAEDDAVLSAMARQRLAECAVWERDGVRIPVSRLDEMPAPVRRRLYLASWEAVGCPAESLGARHLEAVDSLRAPGRAHRVAPVPGHGAFVRSYADLWVLKPGVLNPPRVEVRLPGPGEVRADVLEAVVGWGPVPPADAPKVRVPAGRGRTGLCVRTWRAGDRLDLCQAEAEKVKQVLMDEKVPLWRRRGALVVADDDGIFGLLCPPRSWGAAFGGEGWVWVIG